MTPDVRKTLPLAPIMRNGCLRLFPGLKSMRRESVLARILTLIGSRHLAIQEVAAATMT
jgi:hypothetical protein